MCANYGIPSELEFIKGIFAFNESKIAWWNFDKESIFPSYSAPIIRKAKNLNDIVRVNPEEPESGPEVISASFGLIPRYLEKGKHKWFVQKYHTQNARGETADKLGTYKPAWDAAQFCLVPCAYFHEMNHETGQPVRARIWLKDKPAFAIAGLWQMWRHLDEVIYSYTMLTVNAAGHDVMKHMHRPGDEKRMPVILDEPDFLRWLNATPEEAKTMLKRYPAELMEWRYDPVPPRVKKEKPPRVKPEPKKPSDLPGFEFT